MSPIALVLFDLDGTLADTWPDLQWALDSALLEHGAPRADPAAVRAQISSGARAMTEAALASARAAFDVEAVRHRFLALYRDHIAVRTRLFDGMEDVLRGLERDGIDFGIVTNKLAYLTEPLVDALGLRARLRCLISGDSAPRPKPWPDPLLQAASGAGVEASRCVYIGDALKDVQAARAARMRIVVASYGYLGPDDDPACWDADWIVRHPLELRDWLRSPG